MELEKQICSLALAQKLKELGVNQQSYFYWKHLTDSPTGPIDSWVLVDYGSSSFSYSYYHVSAFTVAELGEMLPVGTVIPMKTVVGKWWRKSILIIKKLANSDKSWHIYYVNPNTEAKSISFTADTEANARAKMLIYLWENKLLEA